MTTNDRYTGWSRIESEDTREMIRQASLQMGDLVRSTLGPLGLDKMVVRRMPDDELRGFVSNDGVAIIEEFEGETDHPVAQHFIALAEDHEDDYGDGVTTMFLLASNLLVEAMDLADQGVHPNEIIEGFSIGAQRTIEHWQQQAISLADPDGGLDEEKLETIAMTGMTNGRTGSWPLDRVANDVVEAVLRVSDLVSGTTRLDHADTIAVPGGTVSDTEVVDGPVLPLNLVVDKYLLPLEGKVLLVDGDLQSREPANDVNIVADEDGDARAAALQFDESAGIAETITDHGVVAVVVTGSADRNIAEELGARGAVMIRNTKGTDFEYIKRATGASPVGPVWPGVDIDPDVLGDATIRFRDTGRDDDWIAFEAPEAGRPAVTLHVSGGTESAAEEAERRIRDGKNALRAAIHNPQALPAGGAADVAAARSVRELAPRFDGREQLAVESFADVLETIPKTLAANAGLDRVETLVDLRKRHDDGFARAGVSSDGRVVDDVVEHDGLDPFQIRTTGLVRAVEFVNDLTRIDSMLYDTREPSVDRVLDEPKYRPGEVPDPDVDRTD